MNFFFAGRLTPGFTTLESPLHNVLRHVRENFLCGGDLFFDNLVGGF